MTFRALIAKPLGNRRGCERTIQPLQGLPVGGRNYHDRPGQPLFAEVAFDKITHFAAAFADQRDNIHVRVRIACDHADQFALTNAAAGHNPDALAFAARYARIDSANSGDNRLGDAAAAHRMRRKRTQGHFDGPAGRGAPIERLAHAVQYAAQQFRPHAHHLRTKCRDKQAAGPDATRIAQRHEENSVVAEADHFELNARWSACAVWPGGWKRLGIAQVANVHPRPGGLNGQSHNIDNSAVGTERVGRTEAVHIALKVHRSPLLSPQDRQERCLESLRAAHPRATYRNRLSTRPAKCCHHPPS